jgi:hypothetical protein
MNWPALGGPYRDVGWVFHVDEDAASDLENPAFQDLYAVFRYAIDRDLFMVLFYDIAEPAAGLPVFRDPTYEAGNPFLYGKNTAPRTAISRVQPKPSHLRGDHCDRNHDGNQRASIEAQWQSPQGVA